ncbi:rhodanese-like domain-containing protein [Gymnodinialimonas hymeniacidonis]|uniref:rhodanese-like domain-containing protein n=1 Tax=Gymnodinialimonas hymeniacidonis TaxID=3126508 RepID=UPI0034C6897F
MPAQFPKITPLEALAAMASDTAPTLLDVRLPEDQDGTRILGAVAVPYEDVAQQAALCPHGAIVICHKGLKISAGATARLNLHRVTAQRLSGGHIGWDAAGLPVTQTDSPAIIAGPLESNAEDALALWAACRFIAPQAEVLEVPRAYLDGVCARFNASQALPLPAIPGLSALANSLDTITLALHAAPPSALFPTFDLAFRGALRHEMAMQEVRA